MHVQETTDPIRWNKFVESHTDANYFHLYEWKYCFEKTYGLETVYFEVCNNNEVVGIFPLTLIGLKGISRRAISLPFCIYGGPLTFSEDIETFLIKEAKRVLQTRFKNIEGIELRKIVTMGSQSGYVSMLRELPDRSEVLWKSLRTKERNQVRKAERSGLEICWGKEYLDEFYAIYTKKMHCLGTPVHPKKWFCNILVTMPEQTDLITVWMENIPVASMLIFKFKDRLFVLAASTITRYNSFCPNTLMYWEVLKYGCENEFNLFDFGRSRIGSSTFNFKKNWGGHPVNLNYEFASLRSQKSKPVGNTYGSTKMILTAKCWSKMPYCLSLWLGPAIRKYVP
jgi:FemAB-related protein (PEP-CTERM system-associated)